MEDGRRADDGRATVLPRNIVSRDRRGIRPLALKGQRVEANRRAPRAFAATRERMIDRTGETNGKTNVVHSSSAGGDDFGVSPQDPRRRRERISGVHEIVSW